MKSFTRVWRRVRHGLPSGPVRIEHCPTCQERADLLRRHRLDCHIPEHGDALRRLGSALAEAYRLAEQVSLLEGELRRAREAS